MILATHLSLLHNPCLFSIRYIPCTSIALLWITEKTNPGYSMLSGQLALEWIWPMRDIGVVSAVGVGERGGTGKGETRLFLFLLLLFPFGWHLLGLYFFGVLPVTRLAYLGSSFCSKSCFLSSSLEIKIYEFLLLLNLQSLFGFSALSLPA